MSTLSTPSLVRITRFSALWSTRKIRTAVDFAAAEAAAPATIAGSKPCPDAATATAYAASLTESTGAKHTALLLPKTAHRAEVLFVVALASELPHYIAGGAVKL